VHLDFGIVTRSLRTIRAIFGTSSGFDGNQGTYLNFSGIVVFTVHGSSLKNQFQQGTVINLKNLSLCPVMSNIAHAHFLVEQK
jgi:hypothetical protein